MRKEGLYVGPKHAVKVELTDQIKASSP